MNKDEKFDELTSDYCADDNKVIQMVGRLMATDILDTLKDRVLDDLADRNIPPEMVLKAYSVFFATAMMSIIEFTRPRKNKRHKVYEYVLKVFTAYMAYNIEKTVSDERKESHE